MPKGGRRVLHSSNGRLLLLGWVRSDGADGDAVKSRLRDLATAFARDE